MAMQLLLPINQTMTTLAPTQEPLKLVKKRPKQLPLTRSELSSLLRFDQLDYFNATAWISWIAPYREQRELPNQGGV